MVRGQRFVTIQIDQFDALIKTPKSLALFMVLLKNHPGKRSEFTIIQDEVGKLIGCERKTLPKYINELMDKKFIQRVHRGTGKGDGHRYRFV